MCGLKLKHFVVLAAIASGWVCHAPDTQGQATQTAATSTRTEASSESLTKAELAAIRAVENERIRIIEKVIGSVIAVYGNDRQGGGSGVIIDPSGIALTNHHVIEGAGTSGLGGLNDGELYEWDLIGTDPGGDVAIIRMKGRDDFPFTPLGDSDAVRIGDWALAMGNPFLLAHDQVPTVTLGIVSGVHRFQEGAGSNQLVYGNCIQVDSSINPGNSGGPLFNMSGEVIGINGRGSFRDRGRVNVGLGYAISSRQIRNFIPDLLATRIVEHGTLDASFSDREGQVVCSTLNLDAPVAAAGLEPGDVLVQFEGESITYANQFKNLICMLPEGWPAALRIRKPDGRELDINVRLFGLPYNFQPDEQPPDKPDPDKPDPDKPGDGKEGDEEPGPDQPLPAADAAEMLKKYLLNEHGVVLDEKVNANNVAELLDAWKSSAVAAGHSVTGWRIHDEIRDADSAMGKQTIVLAADGRYRVDQELDGEHGVWIFDGDDFWKIRGDEARKLSLIEAKTTPVLLQAAVIIAPTAEMPLARFGRAILDGGDKASGRVASRVMLLDDDDDWLYCWLGTSDESGNELVRPRKVSAHLDCLGNGGMMFDEWEMCEGLAIPRRKDHVRGLDEQTLWTARTLRCEALSAIDDKLFQPPEK